MQPVRLEIAITLVIAVPQIFSMTPSSDCLASVDACMSNLCKSQQALYRSICGDDRCQMTGLKACNLTIQTALDQFPSLQGCVCALEEELCGPIHALATQCHQKPGAKQRRSTLTDWKSSSLIGYAYNGAGSCFDQVTICVSDAVCNRHLVPVLQACMAEQCDRDQCQKMTQHFYGSMPHNVAEMLVMCQCEASDQSCVHMKTALHGSTCGDRTWICQDTVTQCAEDSNCRDVLRTFQTKCLGSEEAQCHDLRQDECFATMDPARILGTDFQCKMAFLATLGTALHYPCSCEGLHNDDLLTCNRIHDVLHNRSHFMTSWRSSSVPSKPPEIDESEQGHIWLHVKLPDYLLYAFGIVLLVGVVISLPLAVVHKIWILKRGDKRKFHHPKKSNCVVIL